MSSVQQPLEYVSRASRLDRILRELLHQTPGVEAAAVVSFDGLPMASALPAGMDEDRVAAMSAALLSLAERAAQGLGRGDLSQVYIEGENGTVFLVSAQDEAVLIAVTAADAKVGMMLYEVKLAASRVGEVLRGPMPLPAPLPSHVTRGYLDAHDSGTNSSGSNGASGSYGGYSAQPEVFESPVADASLADLPYSESAYGDDEDASPLYRELSHADSYSEPSYAETLYTETSYVEPTLDGYAARDESGESANDTAPAAAELADAEPVYVESEAAESVGAQAETDDSAGREAAIDDAGSDAAAVEAADEQSDEVYPDRVYTEIVYTEASLTEPTSTEVTDDEDSHDSDEHEAAHNDTAAAPPSYGEPSYYTEPSYYAEPAAAPAAPPAEQPGWSSYAPSGSVLPGGQAWS
jgi:predicted regulator of Ras-like GTPase activity (Roadblock/LC7/MglB family)